MAVNKALAWLRDELREDMDSLGSDPWWWATARSMASGWFALGLLFRVAFHNLIYGAVADDARDRDVTLAYGPCHVRAATPAEAHRIRRWTGLGAVALAAAWSPALDLAGTPAAVLYLGANWGVLAADPLAPLADRLLQTIKP